MEATLTFQTLELAEQFAKNWSRYSKQGHTIGSGTINVDVNIYNIKEDDKKWIDEYINQLNSKNLDISDIDLDIF